MALADNRAKIQALLDGINALPEAGSGEPADPVLQEKSVTPTKAAQAVTPDTGYDGLSKVDVGAIPDEYIVPSGTVSITENGTHDVREAESVNVNVDAPEIALQEKTVAPTTSAQTVTPDSGYDGLSKVTVNAMPTATQATPSIEVSSGGLITAKATQTAGYVAEGTKQATKQLTVQGAQTITPGTADKTIAAGRYLTGTQTIKGDANLLPANIKSGVSIFGVAGTLEEGSGGGTGVTIETNTLYVTVSGYTKNVNGGIMFTQIDDNRALFLQDIPINGSGYDDFEINKEVRPVFGTLTMISLQSSLDVISIISVETEGCDIIALYDTTLLVDVWESESSITIQLVKE